MRKILVIVLLLVLTFPVASVFAAYSVDAPANQGSSGGSDADIQRTIIAPAVSNVASGVPSLNTLMNIGLVNPQTGARSADGLVGLWLYNAIVIAMGTPNSNAGGPSAMVYPGAIGSTLNMTAVALTNPPASSREYVADLMQNMGHPFAPSAYAQGIGFSSLSPVLGLWKVFRNIAYFFFVIIFVFVGFLIMIRSKIGSQAAVTVQQALPKIVISLILVTFSYAIAGLMIDGMYLLIYLLIGIFSTAGSKEMTATTLTDIAFNKNFFVNGAGIIGNLTGNLAGSIGNTVNALTSTVFGGTDAGKAIGNVSGGLTNVVATLVIAVAILVSLFRVFFTLIQAYIGVFFSVILGPLQLLIGALPGQNTFGAWIKGLIENLLVFPTLILLIFIAYYFTNTQTVSFNPSNTGFTAPQLGSNQGSTGFAAFQGIIALGAVLAMPEAMKVAKGLMSGKFDISPKQLVDNLASGNEYGAPLVGGAIGLGTGIGIGAAAGYRNRGTNNGFRSIVGGMWTGAQGPDGKTHGGIRNTIPKYFGQGIKVAKTVDRLRDGQLFDPDNVSKQLDALTKATEANKAHEGPKPPPSMPSSG